MQENLNSYSDKDRASYDRIFGKNKPEPTQVEPCPHCERDHCICIS